MDNNNNFDPNLNFSSLLRDLENANRREDFLAQHFASQMLQQRHSMFSHNTMNNPMNTSLGASTFHRGLFAPPPQQFRGQPFGVPLSARHQQHQQDFLMHHHHRQVQQLQAPPQYGSFMAQPVDLRDSPPPMLLNPVAITEQPQFPHVLLRALNEEKYPDTLRWSDDGKAFHVNYGNPKIMDLLENYFKYKTLARWLNELTKYGWRKMTMGEHKGLMYNKYFHRNMTPEDFAPIIRYKEMNPKAEKALQERNEKSTKSMEAKKTNKEESTKATTLKGKERTKTASKRKETESPVGNKKKRRRTNLPDHKKKPPPPEDKLKLLRKGLRQHKKIHDTFWKWDMWNFPKGLDASLEYQKRLSYIVWEDRRVKSYLVTKKVTKKKKSTKTVSEAEAPTEKEDYAHLLCDEELPDSLFEKDEEQALTEFVERIRKDKLKQDKLKEIWSNIVIPVVKGKVLPSAKFAKPSDQWKELKVGDKIGIFWQKDSLFYNATIQKQQEETSYFQLIYDDDKAEEWLDLSRQKFKILDDFRSTSRRRNSLGEIGDEPIQLPDNYSHLSPFVRYSWELLGLGSNAGTPAYNSYIRERDASVPKATALDLLNDLRKLRCKGFSGFPLQIENDVDSNDDNVENPLRNLQEKLSKDRDAASSIEEFNRALDAVRKLTDTWSIPTVKKNLQTIETQVLKLNEQEARILEKCKQKGIC